jgi:hypothetical protein
LPVSVEELLQDNYNPFLKALIKNRLNVDSLVKKLKSELSAKETKVFKIKTLKKAGDQLIEVEELAYSKPLPAWSIRQKARQDTLGYMGIIITERKEIGGFSGGPVTLNVVYEKKAVLEGGQDD